MYIEVVCWWVISLVLSWTWFANLVIAELPSSRGSRYIRIPFGTEKEWIQDAHRVCFPGLQGWRHRDCVSGTRMGEFLTHRLLLHIHVWHHLWPRVEWLRIPWQTTVSSIILNSSFILSQAVNAAASFAEITALMEFLCSFKCPTLSYICVCRKVFYGQYHCYGPGATSPQRVPWAHELTPLQAKPFLSVNFINGKKWLPHYIRKPKFT